MPVPLPWFGLSGARSDFASELLRLVSAGVLAACLVTARGGVLENARALLSAGKHGDVDVVLAPLLSQTPPSLDALLLSFEAAVADGSWTQPTASVPETPC